MKQVQFFDYVEFKKFLLNPPFPIYILATGSSELCYWVEYDTKGGDE